MRQTIYKLALFLGLILSIQAQDANEQTGMLNSKIRQYQEVMALDTAQISSNCSEVKMYYDRAIEAYDFLSTFTIETMEETLQNIGKLRTLGNDLQEQASSTFEQIALRDQLEQTRNQRRLQELQWRVNWSSTAKSNEVPVQQLTEMKEEITTISGDKQQELDNIISSKTNEQTQLLEQIQLSENTINKLQADKQDLNAMITVISDKLESNDQEIKEEMQMNSTRGEKLVTLELQGKFFEEEKKSAISFEAIKQLAQLQIKTQEEFNQVTSEIESSNNKIALLQESTMQIQDNLITKKAELEQIQLQIQNVNSQLVQIKEQSQSVTNLLQETRQEQQTLFSQLLQQTSFIQMKQELTEKEKELQRAQQKVQEGKSQVERLYREEQMYQESYMRAQQQANEINQKLLIVLDPSEKEQLESDLIRYSNQYQRAWANYVVKKEELVKQKSLLVTFENFETSLQSDELQEQKEAIEEKKQEQQNREEEIERKKEELENKLQQKEEEKGEACAINLQPEELNQTQTEEDDGPIIIPTPTPTTIIPSNIQPTVNSSIEGEGEGKTPTDPTKTIVPINPENSESPEIPNKKYIKPDSDENVDEVPETKQIIVPENNLPIEQKIISGTTYSPQAEKELEKAQQTQKKETLINEVQDLMRRYEELITIKEQHIEDKLKVIIEKEELVLQRETEIKSASERIKQDVQKCKEEKRHIIVEAREERENSRSKVEEQLAIRELQRLNIELKEEFKREGEVYKKKQAAEEREEKVREKQRQLDNKIKEIEEKMFPDLPTPKDSDKIPVDITRMPTPSTPYQKTPSSTIPLAYPYQERTFNFTDEIIQPKPEKELQREEETISQQQKEVEAEKEVVQEQKEEILKEKKEVQLKEYEIQQKEQQFEEKRVEVQEEISKLDKDIERCRLVFGQGDEQSQEYQLCQWQSNDYEHKKKQLQDLKSNYEQELQEFLKSKEEFFKGATVFLETKVEIITDHKLSNNLNTLVQLNRRNKKCLARSIRHKDGMAQLLFSINSVAESLQTVLLQVSDNNQTGKQYFYSYFLKDQVKITLKSVVDEINKLYQTAIVQRNMKQGQNQLLEQKKVLMKMQATCLEAQRILQQQ